MITFQKSNYGTLFFSILFKHKFTEKQDFFLNKGKKLNYLWWRGTEGIVIWVSESRDPWRSNFLQCEAMQETQVWFLGGEDPWRRKREPTTAFWPGGSHAQRSLAGYSPWGHKSQTQLKATKPPRPPQCKDRGLCVHIICIQNSLLHFSSWMILRKLLIFQAVGVFIYNTEARKATFQACW